MKVAVISIDALIYEDLQFLKNRPGLKVVFERASIIPKINGIYPTYTYPCHATVISGCYPNKTGVYHNRSFPKNEWKWMRDNIKTSIVTDYLSDKKTAAVTWPVLGGANIDYLVPEIWAPPERASADSVFKTASSKFGYEYYLKHKTKLDWMRTPGFDEFATACYKDIILEHKPDLSFLHLSYLDHQRHKRGYESEKNILALSFIVEKLEAVVSTFEEADIFDDATFFILGDHGQRNFSRFFHIQSEINKRGYKDRIQVHPSSFSAEIYLSNISIDEAKKVLAELSKDNEDVIEAILDREELKERYNLKGDFDLMVEAKNDVSFSEDISIIGFSDSGDSHAAHGYMPEKGPFSPLIISSGQIYTNLSECNLVDIAPTVLSLFERSMKCDGVVLDYSWK